jgi:hypothetical protein
MTHQPHTHCQCDNCSGVDCGQDNPEEYNKEQTRLQKEHDDKIQKASDLIWATKLNTLIATESKRTSKETVDMVYSYRIAQIIEELTKEKE